MSSIGLLTEMMEAKAKRDTVRAALVRELRQVADLPPSVLELLTVDEAVSEEFAEIMSRPDEEAALAA
jgi:hypothetical protein